MVSQNVEADAAIAVDVGMVDTCGEIDLGWLEGVVGRETDLEEENTASERGVVLTSRKTARVRFVTSSKRTFEQALACIEAPSQGEESDMHHGPPRLRRLVGSGKKAVNVPVP